MNLSRIYKSSPEVLQKLMISVTRLMNRMRYPMRIKSVPSGSSLPAEQIHCYNKQRPYGPRPFLCYAPFTSMFFSRNGFMSPCYATYNHLSDKWPETSIKQAWFNGQFEVLRSRMKLYDLDYACSFCKPLFLSGNFGSLLPCKYEPYGIGQQRYPKIMEFELSNRCNLECIMCDGNLSSSIRRNRDRLPAEPEHYNSAFVEELKEFIPHLLMAEFTGGDPFLIPIYYDIWEQINTLNPHCQILITTNANTMSSRIEEMLRTYNNLHFNISFDSTKREHYEQIRVHADYDTVIKNIGIFVRYCHEHNTTCNLLVCPLTLNSRDLYELVEFANTLTIGIYFHTVVKPPELSLRTQSKEYLTDLIEYLGNFNPPRNTHLQQVNADNYQNLISLLVSWRNANALQSNDVVQEWNTWLSSRFDKGIQEQIVAILGDFTNHESYIKLLIVLMEMEPDDLRRILMSETDGMLRNRIVQFLDSGTGAG